MSYEEIFAPHVHRLKVRGQYQATGLCPFHEDRQSSFSVNFATGQWFCFAGCGHGNHITFARRLQASPPATQPEIAPRRETVTPPMRDGGGGHPSEKKKIKAEYVYHDEFGQPLYKVLRFEPKSFAQMRFDNGKWVGGSMSGVTRVPYRLPQILANTTKPVYWVEGEKDVHKLESIGLVASTSAMGAASWDASLTRWLEQRKVVVLPDNDPPGEAYAARVANDLVFAGARVKLVRLPGLGDKQDVSDYLAIPGNSRDTLLDLVRNAPEYRALHDIDRDPYSYFAGLGIEIERTALPARWQSLCRDNFQCVAAHCQNLTDAAWQILKEVETAWRAVRDQETHDAFASMLMKMHEASR